MRKPLVLAVAQPVCVAHDVAANAAAHADAVRAAGARVVVFPELSLTGYELDAAPVAADDPRLAPIVRACAHTGALALVGAPVRGEGGAEHIAMPAVDGGGAAHAYSKTWLGGAEPERFAPGSGPAGSTSTATASAWRSARTSVSPPTPPAPRPWASTCTRSPPSTTQAMRPSSGSAPRAPPRPTACGSR
ncbi:nitrilase-related carbon-nitrogen hydrolase [Streptomonospora sp. PA3]|uniref:nitrilase-related carbon-nitrogen hydrolase n=1 Tax=Streptomonospora sp. PA3 TaxID=2607326 RepID=UPI002107EB0A|nr:nitrilase-related carbon-nitrogen hydrolase [Streptomonospora sp. PA3]